jgi:hypothetical protein
MDDLPTSRTRGNLEELGSELFEFTSNLLPVFFQIAEVND